MKVASLASIGIVAVWIVVAVVVSTDVEFPLWIWIPWVLAFPVAAVLGVVGILQTTREQKRGLAIALATPAFIAVGLMLFALVFVFAFGEFN